MSKWEQQGGLGDFGNYKKNYCKIWGLGQVEVNLCKLIVIKVITF